MTQRKRKKKLNLKRLFIVIGIGLLLIIGIVLFGIYGIEYLSKDGENKPIIPNTQVAPTEEVYQASLVMVGDALIHSSVYRDANRLAEYNGYDFKPQIEYIKEKTVNYDIAYYNQETILGGTNLGLSDYPTFNSPQEVGDAFIDAGFNLVSLATNHTVDRGKSAVLSSREYWNNQEGVQAVGSYSSIDEKNEIESRVLEKNGITYAMLNYTYGTNGIPVSEDYLVNVWPTNLDLNMVSSDVRYQEYKTTVKNDIEKIRDKVDVLIVAMHWGVEYTHTPTQYEKDMAQFLAENDVDIVIGTHPHVIQPVEWIDDTIVFYSLGNFISAQYQNQGTCSNYKCMVGLMSSLVITKTVLGDNVDIKIDNIKNDLIYTYYTGWSKFKVIPFSDLRIKDYLPSYQSVYDKYSQIISSDDPRIETVALGV